MEPARLADRVASLSDLTALLIDLDGTVYTNAGLTPGALDVIALLRARGMPFKFVTNSTGRSRRALVERLQGYGVTVTPDEVFNAIRAGAALLAERGVGTIMPFVTRQGLEDLAGFRSIGGTSGQPAVGRPDAVVVGDLGNLWTPALLNEAFRAVLGGATLVALQRDPYWLGATGLEMDAGPYVAAIEYATGARAELAGKPNATFYHAALASMGQTPNGAAMIGDDLRSDVEGAQLAGLKGWLVRTGKFRADVLEKSGIRPDRILASFGELAGDLHARR